MEGVAVIVDEAGAVGFEFGLVEFKGVEEGGAVGGGDRPPECGVTGGDARCVAQPWAGKGLPFGRSGALEGAGKGGGENVWQVAGAGDDGVVCFGGCRDCPHPEALPVVREGVERVGRGCFRGGEDADPVFKKMGGGVLKPGFFGTCHGVRADEDGGCGKDCLRGGAGGCLGAAYVGDEGARVQGGDGGGEDFGGLVHGHADDDERGVAHAIGGGVVDAVAPGLAGATLARLGTARPSGEVGGGVAGARGLQERRAEESGAENGNFCEHVFSGLKGGRLMGRFNPFSKQTIQGGALRPPISHPQKNQ